MGPGFLQRLELIVGTAGIERLARTRVALFGLGGVGSWCGEGLVRNGVGSIALVDSDVVCTTNINRQLMATHSSVGKLKADLLAERLRDINPTAEIEAIRTPYDPSTRDQFDLASYDYVIDAIDTLNNKVELMQNTLLADTTLLSALGASAKLDPTRVQVGSFWKVRGCPFGKHLRKRLRNRGIKEETHDFLSVYSNENLPAHPIPLPCGTADCLCPEAGGAIDGTDFCDQKAQINGSSVQVTAVFGFHLVGLVMKDLYEKLGD